MSLVGLKKKGYFGQPGRSDIENPRTTSRRVVLGEFLLLTLCREVWVLYRGGCYNRGIHEPEEREYHHALS